MGPINMKRSSGFSLVEVVLAAVLLSTVIAVLLRVYATSHLFTASELERSVATNLGRQQLEDLYEYVRQDQWATPDLPLSPGTTRGAAATVTVGNQNFTRSYTVSSVNDANNNEKYRKVLVNVSW